MSTAEQMLETYPGSVPAEAGLLAETIAAAFDCAQACSACADACLAEDTVTELRRCIGLDLDCADVCAATGQVLSRQTGYDANLTRAVLQACAQACRSCGDECARHAQRGMAHCSVCADACRRCEDACNRLLAGLG
ncbi:MAG: four-helix bundle copper-binding protein [Actinomycetota bacterium]|nr:four-helix bundle copper-binding protein [Actinomycetota bacterium]